MKINNFEGNSLNESRREQLIEIFRSEFNVDEVVIENYNNFELLREKNGSKIILKFANELDNTLNEQEIKENLPDLKIISVINRNENFLCNALSVFEYNSF